MKSFFKFTLASILGFIISGILLFFIFIGIASSIVSSSQNKETKIKKNTVLVANFSKPINERSSNNPMESINLLSVDINPALGLNDILANIDKAKTDDNIKGIYLNLGSIPSGIATIEEIRNALLDFRESGKFIISYADYYSQSAYYLATAANKIYLNPEGLIDYKGLRAELMFYKGTLAKLGIKPEIIKVGKYKSAVEPFILDKMSDANREQINKFIGSIWNYMLEGISEQRKIAVNDLTKFADNMTISCGDSALKYHFVDSLIYKDQLIEQLKAKVGVTKDKKINYVTMSNYKNAPRTKRKHKGLAKKKIAVIYAQGDIVMGKGDYKQIGSDKLSKAIRQAREDSTIKAIVLRINSPGGSALASEVIWREVKLASETKPVVASMGDLAASGGYYIACAADTIVAHQNTITGSIGVFGILWNGKKFLNKKLGITTDKVTTNKHSDLGSFYRAMEPVEREVIQKEVDKTYNTFISHVSEGRNIEKEKVNEIGQGRVWSGENAKDIGLVDVFGGMKEAVDIAGKMANVENYRIISLPKQKSPLEQIMSDLSGKTKVWALKSELGDNYKFYEKLNSIKNQNGIVANMPFVFDIY